MEETTVDIAIGAQYSTYTYWLLQDYVQWATLAVAAQVIFALRFLWQWIVSERRKESMVPVGFWYLSLAGGAMLTTYAFFRDPVLLLSQGIGVAIYVRNLTMIRQAKSKSLWYASLAAGLAVTIYGFCRRESWESWSRLNADWFWHDNHKGLWIAFGVCGQSVFVMRFIWQWIASERHKASVIPVEFWYFSLAGGLMLSVYAVFRDPYIIPGQTAGVVVYLRNLMLIRRSKTGGTDRGHAADDPPSHQAPARRTAA